MADPQKFRVESGRLWVSFIYIMSLRSQIIKGRLIPFSCQIMVVALLVDQLLYHRWTACSRNWSKSTINEDEWSVVSIFIKSSVRGIKASRCTYEPLMLPQPDSLIFTATNNALAILTPVKRKHFVLMSWKILLQLACPHIPHLDCRVFRCASQQP